VGAAAGDGLGFAVAGVGDVSRNGLDDVALGAPFSDPDGVNEAGTAYLVEGSAPADLYLGVIDVGDIGTTVSGQQYVGVQPGEHAGAALSETGDLSGDSETDMLVGAPEKDAFRDDDVGSIYLVVRRDWDGDEVLDEDDCDPDNGEVWETPGEARSLILDHDRILDRTEVHWSEPAVPGGLSVRYDTIRSAEPYDFLNAAVCIESDDGTDTLAVDFDGLPPYGLACYLVRAENDCPDGSGSLGDGPDGHARTARNCP
jgi:hypothetical protein